MATYAEYRERAVAFRRDLLDPRVPFPDKDDGWLSVAARVTCHTDGCRLGSVVTTLYENADGVYRAHCALCQGVITDVVGIFDDSEEHRLPA